MNKFWKRLTTSILAMLFLCLFLIPGAAEEPGEETVNNPVAEVNIGSYGIGWTPKIGYAELFLTVSMPDGNVIGKTFPAGVTPTLDLSGINGHALIDGSYTYELRAIPTAEKRIRESGVNDTVSYNDNQGALVQSGAFMIDGGKFVTSRPVAPNVSTVQDEGDISRTMDLCYQDDMVVQFSLCVGVDCVCNMNFGFDTIVLKENNLRIFFDDTSTSSGFPSNDWRLIANDSASGGASYFSIEDSTAGRRVFTVEAGAPTNSLYVDDGGRVGIGTSTPSTNLHVRYCNTPTLRLDQDSSCGWSPQAWDVAGNEANFFIRDVTNGSRLPFRIQPGAPTNGLTLRADGRIGMGTWAPGYPVHLLTNSSTNAAFVAERTGGATNYMNATASYSNFGSISNHPVRIVANGAWKMTINQNGTIDMSDGGSYNGTWNPASSRTIKENIKDLSFNDAAEALEKLNPVKFNYIKSKDEARVGFIAEDVPELVATKSRKNLSTMDIVAVITKVVQEQQKTIAELKKEMADIKNKKD